MPRYVRGVEREVEQCHRMIAAGRGGMESTRNRPKPFDSNQTTISSTANLRRATPCAALRSETVDRMAIVVARGGDELRRYSLCVTYMLPEASFGLVQVSIS